MISNQLFSNSPDHYSIKIGSRWFLVILKKPLSANKGYLFCALRSKIPTVLYLNIIKGDTYIIYMYLIDV